MAEITQADAEAHIRRLCKVWADERGIPHAATNPPSFLAFSQWMDEKGYSHVFSFRATIGAKQMAEMWFDQELGQMWRQ
ncbi:hypothetical protein [Bosea sp. OK403]|uniref:hypothetical protein n=1 Tax=Bosea sp. OK403 TaxID=1855286 RepID=UPI0011136BBA|nr:hypothetical protein [Bosea sp. OK403]